jgi:hypothetical protein
MLRNGIRLIVFCMEARRLSRSAQTGGAFMHDEQKRKSIRAVLRADGTRLNV